MSEVGSYPPGNGPLDGSLAGETREKCQSQITLMFHNVDHYQQDLLIIPETSPLFATNQSLGSLRPNQSGHMNSSLAALE